MTKLTDLDVDALHDLARVRDVAGHTDMTREELLDALDGAPDEALAPYLGQSRKNVYDAAKDAGIEDPMDKQKKDLLRELADKN